MLNKQRMEEKRTDEFLKYALGSRSPEKTNYFKSKYMNKNYRLKYTAARDKNNSFFMSSEHFNRKGDREDIFERSSAHMRSSSVSSTTISITCVF